MNHRAVLSVLALVLTLVCVERSFCQEARSKESAIDPTESELVDRFNRILDKEFAEPGVYLSFKASVEIQKRVRLGAATIISENAFGRLPEAEINLKIFARKLVRHAEIMRGGRPIRITLSDVEKCLAKDDHKSSFGLCPLFPICK